MRISDAKVASKSLPVPFEDGQVLTVQYRPSSFTPEQLDAMAEATKDGGGALMAGKPGTRVIEQLRNVVTAWDLTEDDGTPIPIEWNGKGKDPLAKVPLSIMMEVMKAIGRDQSAGEVGKDSGAS